MIAVFIGDVTNVPVLLRPAILDATDNTFFTIAFVGVEFAPRCRD